MIEVAEAEALILANAETSGAARAARGLRRAACSPRTWSAERDQPPFDRVTMDGIAIAYRDFAAGARAFAVVGHAGRRRGAARDRAPGAMRRGDDGRGAAARHGHRGPGGARAAQRHGGEDRGRRRRRRPAVRAPRAAATARPAASCCAPARASARPRSPCSRARAARRVAVAALPRVAVISTGDELVDVDKPLAPDQIRSSNDRAIEASLTQHRLRRSPAHACATTRMRSPTRSRARRRARRARLERRRLDGPVRLRAGGARGARREARVSQGRATARANRCGSA